MKKILTLALATVLLASCATPKASVNADLAAKKPKAGDRPMTVEATDALDDYGSTAKVSDPLEKLNRATFWLNDGLYTVIFRPISKGYEKILPKLFRKSVDNVFENAKYPVRVVNCVLQGKGQRAGLETKKFFVNTVAGFGGILRVSDKVPDIADLPAEDSGQTLAKWGVGHGPYIVLPLLGPSSAREVVGLAGDYALNPPNYGLYFHGGNANHDWMLVPPPVNTLRSMPDQLEKYDAATKEAVDPYISAREAYVQQRDEAAKK